MKIQLILIIFAVIFSVLGSAAHAVVCDPNAQINDPNNNYLEDTQDSLWQGWSDHANGALPGVGYVDVGGLGGTAGDIELQRGGGLNPGAISDGTTGFPNNVALQFGDGVYQVDIRFIDNDLGDTVGPHFARCAFAVLQNPTAGYSSLNAFGDSIGVFVGQAAGLDLQIFKTDASTQTNLATIPLGTMFVAGTDVYRIRLVVSGTTLSVLYAVGEGSDNFIAHPNLTNVDVTGNAAGTTGGMHVNAMDGAQGYKVFDNVCYTTELPEFFELTVQVEPGNIDPNVVSPKGIADKVAGPPGVPLSAGDYVDCPNTWVFDHWTGPVANAGSANTTVTGAGGQSITVTAHYVIFNECNDACHPPPTITVDNQTVLVDYNKDCIVNGTDFAIWARDAWLLSNQP